MASTPIRANYWRGRAVGDHREADERDRGGCTARSLRDGGQHGQLGVRDHEHRRRGAREDRRHRRSGRVRDLPLHDAGHRRIDDLYRLRHRPGRAIREHRHGHGHTLGERHGRSSHGCQPLLRPEPAVRLRRRTRSHLSITLCIQRRPSPPRRRGLSRELCRRRSGCLRQRQRDGDDLATTTPFGNCVTAGDAEDA